MIDQTEAHHLEKAQEFQAWADAQTPGSEIHGILTALVESHRMLARWCRRYAEIERAGREVMSRTPDSQRVN